MELLKPASIVSIFYLNILILCIQGNPSFSNFPLQGQINSSLLNQILNVESGDKVPEYEVVQLRILSKRSADDQNVIRVDLSAFGKDIHLRLQRNDDLDDRVNNVKLFEASLTDTGVKLTEVIVEDDDPGTLYLDPVQMAAVTVRHGHDGRLQMDGVIGDNLLIKPAPSDNFLADYFFFDAVLSEESGDRLNSSGNDASYFSGYTSAATKSGVHIVYRSPMKSKTSLKALDDIMDVDDVLHMMDSADDGRRHNRPLHAWPEVLLMVDYDSYAMHVSHGFNNAQIKRYCVSFLNGVDLRFKILSDPKISLILSQIVVFKSRDATPFLKNNIFRNLTLFKGHKTIKELSRYLYSVKMQQQGIYPEFDVAVLLTKLDMCADEWLSCNPAAAGLAPLMGACNMKPKDESWLGVAIVEDSGGFDGILIAAHEIGHLFGANHDGDRSLRLDPRYRSVCSNEDGYLMSTRLGANRIFQWSECSIKQIRHFLSSEGASCLFNQPNYRNKLEGSELPGVVLSLDEQCKRIWGTRASAWDSQVCVSLHCLIPTFRSFFKSKLPVVLPPAAEGSYCGEDLHCRHGKCVSKFLTDSQAWNMVPVNDSSEYIDTLTVSTTKRPPIIDDHTTTVRTTKRPPIIDDHTTTVSTTKKPPIIDEGCKENKLKLFVCEIYFWAVGPKEACKTSIVPEHCCYFHKIYCKVGSL